MQLTETDQFLILEAIDYIRRKIDEGCERHYDSFLFGKPNYPGETPLERYTKTYCSYETGLIGALEELAWREAKPTQAEIEASWRENPDRMGGQFTEEELNRSGWT